MATDRGKASGWRRVGQAALKVVGLFVILEPIWMLLPFAGFLYGSVLHIQALNRNPHTARLTHFVFPILTLGWLGPVLVVVGLALFCVGAAQIYWAKIRRSGLVTRGLYRFIRHPQYVALTLFGVGILLTWGRAVTFIAFFAMMFLYYYLAKSEERTCLRGFGKEYMWYRKRTSFILPGDRFLRPLRRRLGRWNLPAALRVPASFAATMAVCFLLIWLIDAVKAAVQRVPYKTADVLFGDASAAATRAAPSARLSGGVAFVQSPSRRIVVARGPWRSAAAPGVAERVLLGVQQSAKLRAFLAFLDEEGGDVAFIFCGRYEPRPEAAGPGMDRGGGAGGRGPTPDPAGPDRIRLVLMRCRLREGASAADALADKAQRTVLRGCVAHADLSRADDRDIIEGEASVKGPGFPGERLWESFLKRFRERGDADRQAAAAAVVPGRHERATLVLVQAPILRTRVEPAFAEELLDRLVLSETFRDRLRKAGAGGLVVPVAFPRPGPNWYREHHGKPQISVFVVMARLRPGCSVADLFDRDSRTLLGAFRAEMDLRIERPGDCVRLITRIGPRRDLEERWRFFLSGVGRERT